MNDTMEREYHHSNDRLNVLQKHLPDWSSFWNIFHSTNWRDRSFDIQQAYICCVVASLAYAVIPELELRANSRFKVLVPSQLFQVLFAQRMSASKTELGRLDALTPFIIPGELTVVVGMRFRDILFVGVRGTAKFYDIISDIDVRRVSVETGMVHRGFFMAANESIKELRQHVSDERRRAYDVKLCLTGHSLGGAVAAILCRDRDLSPFSSYTFGAPRYGNTVVCQASSFGEPPHHVRDRADIVPHVPPKWLGFGDPPIALELGEGPQLQLDTVAFLRRTLDTIRLKPVKSHFIEHYRDQLAMKVKARPKMP